MKKIILFLILFFPLVLIAQQDSSRHDTLIIDKFFNLVGKGIKKSFKNVQKDTIEHSQTNEIKYSKEVGISIPSLYEIILTGDNNYTEENKVFDLTIKQYYKNNYSFRLKLGLSNGFYIFEHNFYGSTKGSYNFNGTDFGGFKRVLLNHTDSTDTYKDYFFQINRNWEINFALEKKIRFTYINLIAGLNFGFRITPSSTLIYKSQYKYNHFNGCTMNDGHDYNNFSIGGFPYIGIQFPITKRVYLSCNTGLNWYYYFLRLKPFDGTSDLKRFRGEMASNSIIGDITVSYRFNLWKK